MDAIYTLGLINSNRLCKDSVLKGLYPIILLNFFKLKVILFIPSFFDLVNTPDTKLFILDIYVSLFLGTFFSSTDKWNKNLKFNFGVFIKTNLRIFSMKLWMNWLLRIFSLCAKYCLRLGPLKFWTFLWVMGNEFHWYWQYLLLKLLL